MLLRSASTPILGSLLNSTTTCSFSESPHHHQPLERTNSTSSVEILKHVSFSSPSPNHQHHPISSKSLHSTGDRPPRVRRVRSAGNLENLAASDPPVEVVHPSIPSPVKPNPRRSARTLETIPSFSVYGSKAKDPGEEEEEGMYELERSVTIGESISFAGGEGSVGLGRRGGDMPLFLAVGLGLDENDPSSAFVNIGGSGVGGKGSGGGGGSVSPVLTGSGGDKSELEMFYKRMVEENPGDALFLRNYAQFLYQSKGDPEKAEEYYSRAILAEPGDGEIISQYARLIWDLHHDHERASSYFEQAVQAAPQDSHVLAAYANFLWETDDDDGVESFDRSPVSLGALASASA